MKGAPLHEHEKLDRIDTVLRCVDQRGREMDRRWGFGRLTMLVPIEWAERFRVQRRKFSAAVWEREPDDVTKHGDAMLRAYAKLDELAVAAGALPAPPEQWEFDGPDGLVIVVRELADVGRADTGGRQAQVWSLEEVSNVIFAHPLIAQAKDLWPGCEVESVRPDLVMQRDLNDALMEVPFT